MSVQDTSTPPEVHPQMEDVPQEELMYPVLTRMELMYLVFTRMPGEIYHSQLRSLLLPLFCILSAN